MRRISLCMNKCVAFDVFFINILKLSRGGFPVIGCLTVRMLVLFPVREYESSIGAFADFPVSISER